MTKNPSRKTLSFAEAEGKIRFPAVLAWGNLDQRVRAALWNCLFPYFDAHIGGDDLLGQSWYATPLGEILRRDYVQRRHGFISDFIEHYPSKRQCLEDWASIFRQYEYIELFDFLSSFLRDPDCPKAVIHSVAAALDKPWSPYRLIVKPPTVVPAISKQQAAIIKRNLGAVFDSDYEGSKTHVQAALDALNQENFRGVVRESIHGVESAIRDYTQDPKANFVKRPEKAS